MSKKEKVNSFILVLYLFMSSITIPLKLTMGNGNIVWIITGVSLIISFILNKKCNIGFIKFLYLILLLGFFNILIVDYKQLVVKEIINLFKFCIVPLYLATQKINFKYLIKYIYNFSIFNAIILLVFKEDLAYMDFGMNMVVSFWGIAIYCYIENKKRKIILLLVFLNIFLYGNRSSLLICITIIIFLEFRYRSTITFIVKSIIIVSIATPVICSAEKILIFINQLAMSFNVQLYSIQKYIMAFDVGIIESSSGRDRLFLESINIIKESWMLPKGLGYFTQKTNINYPHNIILESVIILGALGSLIMVCLIIFKLYKLCKLCSFEEKNLIISLMLFVIVWLMFSSSFILEYKFWILIGLMNNFILKGEKCENFIFSIYKF